MSETYMRQSFAAAAILGTGGNHLTVSVRASRAEATAKENVGPSRYVVAASCGELPRGRRGTRGLRECMGDGCAVGFTRPRKRRF